MTKDKKYYVYALVFLNMKNTYLAMNLFISVKDRVGV